MSFEHALPAPTIGLDDLLAGIARGVVSAQAELDRAARVVDDGAIVRAPWFIFDRTVVELELSTFTVSGGELLQCKTLDPVAVALRGYTQASGTKVSIEIAPLGSALLRRE